MDAPISFNPNQQVRNKKNNTPIIIGIVLVIILLISLLIFGWSRKTKQSEVTPTPTKEISPTEKPKIDKTSVKAQVLNGTGTPGQAGIVVEVLKKAGYNPDNIKTANAEAFDNTVTTITAKDGFDDVAGDIKDILKGTFDEINIDSSHLDKDNEFDIVITTGGKKFEEATPTQNPAPSPTTADTTITPTPTSTPSPTPTP